MMVTCDVAPAGLGGIATKPCTHTGGLRTVPSRAQGPGAQTPGGFLAEGFGLGFEIQLCGGHGASCKLQVTLTLTATLTLTLNSPGGD